MSAPTSPQDTAPPRTPRSRPSTPEPPADGPDWSQIALRIGLPIAAFAVLGLIEPAIITAIVNSPRAIAIVVGIVAATVGWSALLRRFVNGFAGEGLVRTGLVLLPIAIVMGLFVAPYLGPDQVVDQALPGLETSAVVADGDGTAEAGGTSGEAADEGSAGGDAAAEDAAVDGPAEDAGATAAQAAPSAEDPAAGDASTGSAGSGDQTAPDGDAAAADEAAPADVPPAPAPPAGPVELSRGSFVGLDDHFANGDAALYELEDGSFIVRLDEVELQRVPEPYVYLVPGLDQTAPVAGSLNLGALAGNVGSSNYVIPADVDVAGGEWTVLVWCEPFASPVGAASQTVAA